MTSSASPDSIVRVVPRQQRSISTLGRIEAAARHVLATVGRDRFTTADVAARAEVSIGTFYRYFPGRTELLEYIWPDRRDTYLPKRESAAD